MQSKHKQTKYENSRQKNYLKDNIEFVTELPCLLGHPVVNLFIILFTVIVEDVLAEWSNSYKNP